jgi:hypothetical protein
MEGQNTIYHEGGDSYRPIIIIPINDTNLWPNKNIAYFRSSGRTNKTPQYSNTWFPLAGFVEQNNTTILRNTFNTGHIIKMSDLLAKKDSSWKSNLCMEYFRPLENQSFDKILSTLNPNSSNIDAVELLFNEAFLIKQFLDSYFFSDWQLRISAQIGGGFWDRNSKFCTFVLGLNRIPVINVPRMPDYFSEAEGGLAEYVQGDVQGDNGLNNTDYLIDFLKQNQAQLELPSGLESIQQLEKTSEDNDIPKVDGQTRKDYENSILRANGRIQEIKRTIALLAKMNLGSKKTPPVKVESIKVEPIKVESVKVEPVKVEPVKVEPVKLESVIPQNNIEQLNTDDDIVPQNKKKKIESNERTTITINTNEPTTRSIRSTRSAKIPQQTGLIDDTKKRKRGGKTIKRKGKTIKRKRGGKTIKRKGRKNTKRRKLNKRMK